MKLHLMRTIGTAVEKMKKWEFERDEVRQTKRVTKVEKVEGVNDTWYYVKGAEHVRCCVAQKMKKWVGCSRIDWEIIYSIQYTVCVKKEKRVSDKADGDTEKDRQHVPAVVILRNMRKVTTRQVVNLQPVCHQPSPIFPWLTQTPIICIRVAPAERSSSLSLPPRWDKSHFVAIIITSLRATLTQMRFSFFVKRSINEIIVVRWSGGD